MSPLQILLVKQSPDMKADVIEHAVRGRHDMQLLFDRAMSVGELSEILRQLGPVNRLAIVLVGWPDDTRQMSQKIFHLRDDAVILQVDIPDADVRFDIRDPGLEELFNALRSLATGAKVARETSFKLEHKHATEPKNTMVQSALYLAAVDWLNAVIQHAVEQMPEDADVISTAATSKTSICHDLEAAPEVWEGCQQAAARLQHALSVADPQTDRLSALHRGLGLTWLEFRLLILALGPELGIKYQRAYGFLQDDMSRRTGSLVFYCSLLDRTLTARFKLSEADAFSRWRILDNSSPAADEPIQLDSALVRWILGDVHVLLSDTLLQGLIRLEVWQGRELIHRSKERAKAKELIDWLTSSQRAGWLVLSGNQSTNWKALLESACQNGQLIRICTARLKGDGREMRVDWDTIAARIARLRILLGWPLVIDVGTEAESGSELSELLRGLTRYEVRAAIVCNDLGEISQDLGRGELTILTAPVLSKGARTTAVLRAARLANAKLEIEEAVALQARYPLSVEQLENASKIARGSLDTSTNTPSSKDRFLAACQQLATARLSRYSQPIDPKFHLKDVILPKDQSSQLYEIVNQVRLAAHVFDGWSFGSQLPYGRGVTALFYGPSGTGKTMAAMGIANELQVPLLKLDLSRIVSKYIGETEKNIDQVFCDAERSGGAMLIDEADALLGKRSEVKDAHDRYANIEVAYLLQRMEDYSGLAILTTNMRQNLDAAFVRRLRFIIEFPKPSVEAREGIWRFCLPAESHALDDAAFRHLARRVDLTGGNIRQITLRAAFLAAAAGSLIQMQHLIDACRAELSKLGLPPVELDITLNRRVA